MNAARVASVLREHVVFVSCVLLLSVMSGLVMVPAIDNAADRVRDIYDKHTPIADIQITRLASDPGEVHVRMVVTKLRACELINVQAFEEVGTHHMQRINAHPINRETPSDVPRGMTVRGLEWRIWPTSGGALELRMIYDCDGRTVRMPVRVP